MPEGWFLKRDGTQVGPISPKQLAELARTGMLHRHDLVRRDGTTKWLNAGLVKGLVFPPPGPSATGPQVPPELFATAVTPGGLAVELFADGTWRRLAQAEPANPGAKPAPQEITGSLRLLSESGPNFRLARWGMSPQQVRDTEHDSICSAADDLLIYETTFAARPCKAHYGFRRGRLTSGSYVFDVETLSADQSIGEYVELKTLLTATHGVPSDRKGTQIDQIWVNDAYRQDPGNWGRAISLGHLTFLTVWTLEQTRVNLVLKGNNYDIRLMVEHVSLDSLAQR